MVLSNSPNIRSLCELDKMEIRLLLAKVANFFLRLMRKVVYLYVTLKNQSVDVPDIFR